MKRTSAFAMIAALMTGCAPQVVYVPQQDTTQQKKSRNMECIKANQTHFEYVKDLEKALLGCERNLKPGSKQCVTLQALLAIDSAAGLSQQSLSCYAEGNVGGLSVSQLKEHNDRMESVMPRLKKLHTRINRELSKR